MNWMEMFYQILRWRAVVLLHPGGSFCVKCFRLTCRSILLNDLAHTRRPAPPTQGTNDAEELLFCASLMCFYHKLINVNLKRGAIKSGDNDTQTPHNHQTETRVKNLIFFFPKEFMAGRTHWGNNVVYGFHLSGSCLASRFTSMFESSSLKKKNGSPHSASRSISHCYVFSLSIIEPCFYKAWKQWSRAFWPKRRFETFPFDCDI